MTHKIEVRGLPRGTDEDDILDLCIEFGDVTDVQVSYRPTSGPVVLVSFRESHEALRAAEALDGAFVDGCRVRAWPAQHDARASDGG